MALRGIQVLELAGLAPGPLCGMILADFGASVIVVDKVGPKLNMNFLSEGKSSMNVDLKNSKGQEFFRRMVKQSDVLIEPFRAGVMEKLNLSPETLLKDNPKLIFARLTGYGQSGPYSSKAGHDINYVSLSGLFSLFGWRNKQPTPPANFAADFAGGGLSCALGIVMALFEREKSGQGQVVDASMVEGAAYTGSWFFHSKEASFLWSQPRGQNPLDGGAFFYDTYETKDGKWMAVGAVEPQFYSAALHKLGIAEESLPQYTGFQKGHEVFAEKFRTKTQNEWCEIFNGDNECVTPVLSLEEVADHPHNKSRNSFSRLNNLVIPNPAPKLSRTPGASSALSQNSKKIRTEDFIKSLGISEEEISRLISDGVIEFKFRASKM
ncbi:unnamed protein product [Bemisia tabaci]|uniref:Alpha-methylacyl-CoA racemase n=1 Tax=Bemisia tabaci TaxID=7038 RepID=A0A9P0AD79_BEMTA|nr:unnamed protein product [Bemisia tabaci]